MKRKYDIILWGCTGFTGKLVANYLKGYSSNLKIGLGGRNFSRVSEIKKNYGLESMDVIVASLDDMESLNGLTGCTHVVISVAGPFARVGLPIVDSCITTSTHYVDITGEPQFVRTIIDRYHEIAIEKGVKIVPCCGFDCIPSDFGCQLIVDEMKQRGLLPLEVQLLVDKVKGGASGGTIASVINLLETSSLSFLKELSSPFYLNPRDVTSGNQIAPTESVVVNKCSDSTFVGYDRVFRKYTTPYIMQSIDTRIVHRSNALKGWQYGNNFVYGERMLSQSFLLAFITSAAITFGGLCLLFPPFRWLLKRFVLPLPGQGPSEELQQSGFFTMNIWGRGLNVNTGTEEFVTARLESMQGDPGYAQTARFVAESAIACLPREKGGIEGIDLHSGGVLTPSTAFGPKFRERLHGKIGLQYFVDDDVHKN